MRIIVFLAAVGPALVVAGCKSHHPYVAQIWEAGQPWQIGYKEATSIDYCQVVLYSDHTFVANTSEWWGKLNMRPIHHRGTWHEDPNGTILIEADHLDRPTPVAQAYYVVAPRTDKQPVQRIYSRPPHRQLAP